MPTTVFAEDNKIFTEDDIRYKVLTENEDAGYTVAVTNNQGYPSSVLTIPASVNHNGTEYEVINIEHYAFIDCLGIETLHLSEGLYYIGKEAFKNTGITGELSIPSSVRYIIQNAFTDCTNITSLKLPENGVLETIALGVFKGTSISGRITVPASLETIGGNAFQNLSGITELVIPDNSKLRNIYSYAFSNTGVSGSIDIPANLWGIGSGAFQNCTALTTLNMPKDGKLTEIGAYAFSNTGITGTLSFPENLKKISAFAFLDCSDISGTLNIPAGVTTIDYGAFRRCSNIEAVIFAGDIAPNCQYDDAFGEVDAKFYYPDTGTGYQSAIPGQLVSYDDTTAKILTFNIDGIKGEIDEENKTISLNMPWDIDLTNLFPTVGFIGSSIDKDSIHLNDFTSPQMYTVISESGQPESYTVTVTKDASPNQLTEKLTLSKNSLTLNIGQNEVISATTEPANASDKRVVWSTSNPGIVKIDNKGRIIAVAPGSATISAAARDGSGKKASFRVTVVRPEVISVSISPKDARVERGKTYKFTASAYTTGDISDLVSLRVLGGTDSYIDMDGILYVGHNEKSKTLTIEAISPFNYTKRCTARVTVAETPEVPADVSEKQITIIKSPVSSAYLKKKSSMTLPVIAYSKNSQGHETAVKLIWKSSKPSVASVSKSGKVRTKKNGKATITATANDRTLSIKVNVVSKKKALKKITLKKTPKTLKVGETTHMKVKLSPAKATNVNIKFKSSNKNVVKVDKSGYLVAKKKGISKITVKAGGKKTVITVKVQ